MPAPNIAEVNCTRIQFEDGDPTKPIVTGYPVGTALNLTLAASAKVKLDAPLVEAGGTEQLVKFIPLQAWVVALTTAGVSVGLTVPALTAANTTVLTGG